MECRQSWWSKTAPIHWRSTPWHQRCAVELFIGSVNKNDCDRTKKLVTRDPKQCIKIYQNCLLLQFLTKKICRSVPCWIPLDSQRYPIHSLPSSSNRECQLTTGPRNRFPTWPSKLGQKGYRQARQAPSIPMNSHHVSHFMLQLLQTKYAKSIQSQRSQRSQLRPSCSYCQEMRSVQAAALPTNMASVTMSMWSKI